MKLPIPRIEFTKGGSTHWHGTYFNDQGGSSGTNSFGGQSLKSFKSEFINKLKPEYRNAPVYVNGKLRGGK